MNRAIVCLAAGFATSIAGAQDEDPQRTAARQVADVVTDIEEAFECDITMHGAPRFDEFSNTWLVAYSVSGDDCGAAATELAARGERLGATFYRRPNPREINGVAGSIAVEVGRGFHCTLAIRGEPSFNEQSAYWSVSYSAVGSDCPEAELELRRRGRELQIVFIPIRGGRNLLR